MLKPICVPCQRFYRPKKNGFVFIEGMPIDQNARPGKETPELWQPYKLWIGDKWKCEGCGNEIVVGVCNRPINEQHKPDFKSDCDAFHPQLTVNDC